MMEPTRARPKPHAIWHRGEVYLKIDGYLVHLWQPSMPRTKFSLCWSRPEDQKASHKRKRTLATSSVASGIKPTSSIADKSPGHNQKEEERQKCKGDGYDHFCSAERGSLR